MDVTRRNRRHASVSSELFSHMLDYMYERVYDPQRSGFIKMKEFEKGTQKQIILSDVMRYMEKTSPVGGLNVELYRGRTANGMIWHVTKSDVHGPVYYPHVMPPEIDCDEFRQRLLDGSDLKKEVKNLGINLHEARRHARGNCSCDNSIRSLDYHKSNGWVKSYLDDTSSSMCHGGSD